MNPTRLTIVITALSYLCLGAVPAATAQCEPAPPPATVIEQSVTAIGRIPSIGMDGLGRFVIAFEDIPTQGLGGQHDVRYLRFNADTDLCPDEPPNGHVLSAGAPRRARASMDPLWRVVAWMSI